MSTGLTEEFRHLSLRIEQKIDEQGQKLEDSVGAVKDTLTAVKSTIDGWREICNMSKATHGKHDSIFYFAVVDEDPPMVEASDARISNLVKQLKRYRKVTGFRMNDEPACREHAIDCFFKEVANALGSEIVNSARRLLTVRVAQTEFSGLTDLLVGQETTLPLLTIEVKPMLGEHRLRGEGFNSEKFGHKAQIVLQCAALQAQCVEYHGLFSCVLTNLKSLYIVQVTAYDANTISSRAFRVVKDETKFVRALLRAADDNGGLIGGTRDKALICESAQGFDSARPHPAHGGIQQFPQRSSVDTGSVVRGGGEPGGGDISGTTMVTKQAAWNFERLLPTPSEQKSDVRPNFTRAWVRLSSREYLNDLNSSANVFPCAGVFE